MLQLCLYYRFSYLCYDTLLLQPNTQAFEQALNDCMNRKVFSQESIQYMLMIWR